MASSAVVVVAAVVVVDTVGRVLTVRKTGTTRFMLPGGKPEPGEDLRQTAVRELAEEVGLALDEGDLEDWGIHTADAANERDTLVRAGVYAWRRRQFVPLAAAAEIAELRWLDIAAPDGELAPLLVSLLPRIADFEEDL